jgi:phenylpropionate dioxygenase-like ring-hydroxylating dioxygenase large terminal subunit
MVHKEFALRRLVDNIRDETMADLDPDVLEIPVAVFFDDDRARREVALLRSLPVVAAHRAELAEPGQTLERTILGFGLLLARRADGTVIGRTVTADAVDGPGGARAGRPVAVEERHGHVWVVLSEVDDVAVDDFLGDDVEEALSEFVLDDSVVFVDKGFDLPINWKLVLDGATDVLHPKFLHANGVGKLIVTGRSMFLKYGRHGQNFNARKRLERVADGTDSVEQALSDFWRYVSTSVRIYPNAICIAAPDHNEFWTVWPDADDPRHCTVNIRFLVRRDRLTDEIATRITRSWEILEEAAVAEDFPMESSIQANAYSNPGTRFVYGRNEVAIRHLHETLERDLARHDGLEAGVGVR